MSPGVRELVSTQVATGGTFPHSVIDPEGTEDWDQCPVCKGDWLKCDHTLEEADAAYPGDAA